MSVFYATYSTASSGGGGGNAAAGPTGSPVPASGDYIAFNVGGTLTGVSLANPLPVTIDGGLANPLNVNIADFGGTAVTIGQQLMAASMPVAIASNQSAIPSSQSGTWNITNITGTVSLPTGASTSALQSNVQSAPGTPQTTALTIQGNASGVPVPISGTTSISGTVGVTQSTSPWIVAGGGTAGTPGTAVLTVQGVAGGTAQPVSGTVAATQSGTWTVQPGNTANTTAWLVTGTGGTFPATQSGAWNITNITGTVSLPTGASTSANQTTLGSQTTKINDGTNTAAVKAASTAPLATDPALVVTLSPNGNTVVSAAAVNTNGSANNSTTVTNTSATTFSPPANAVGFVVEAESSNTVNLRYACGTTATTTTGMLLEPGRDSGFIPSKGTVTVICATAATNQAAGIQWVLSS